MVRTLRRFAEEHAGPVYIYDIDHWSIKVLRGPTFHKSVHSNVPSGARGGTGCGPHNSSVFSLGGAASTLNGANTGRQWHQLKCCCNATLAGAAVGYHTY